MRASNKCLDIIKACEGYSATPYICPAGYLTIGYGHLLKDKTVKSVTREEAETLLRSDVVSAENAVNRLVKVRLTQNQFDALVDFVYNLGAGAFQRSTLRQVVNREEHEDVPEQLVKWCYAGGRRLQGLLHRRQLEATLYVS